jgi:hypothetical protein
MLPDAGADAEAEFLHTISQPVTTWLISHEAELPPGGLRACWDEYVDELRALSAARDRSVTGAAPVRDLTTKLTETAMRAVLARWGLSQYGPEFRKILRQAVHRWLNRSLADDPVPPAR